MLSSYQVTTNLTSEEVACPCCGQVHFEQRFVNLLQMLRDILDIPFHYKPGGFFRCGLYQETLRGGATNSQHPLGRACDIRMINFNGFTKWKLIHEAMKLGLSVGAYSAHIHLDLRPGTPVFYYGKYVSA